jgi:uncharacterized protein (DUF1800 family)
MSDSLAAAIAANRFGLGARPGELARIAGDPQGALAAQLEGAAPLLSAPGLTDSATALEQAQALRHDRRQQRRPERGFFGRRRGPAAGEGAPADAAPPPVDVVAAAMKIGQLYRPMYVADAGARLRAAVASDRPLTERLVHFWANHFAISVDKGVVLGLAGSFEREAIRPNVLGRFGDLLRSVEQHPAMLLYLDNAQSVGPASQAAVRIGLRGARAKSTGGGLAGTGRSIGLNENLAREIMELHTLGVDGGYSQADVTEFARAITGWSIGGGQGRFAGGEPGRFYFRAGIHEPGARTIMGRRYSEGGLDQGIAVLDALARSPATAHHIATQLARHFVGDEPAAALVERVARAFERSEGDLPTVYRALIESPEAWAQPLAKYKTPADFIHSAWRAVDLPLPEGPRALAPFELLGQRTWQPGSPAGWPDRAPDWDGPSALLKRVEWADQVGQRLGARRNAQQLGPDVLGATLGARTREAVARADSPAQALTLLLASPEFLRR